MSVGDDRKKTVSVQTDVDRADDSPKGPKGKKRKKRKTSRVAKDAVVTESEWLAALGSTQFFPPPETSSELAIEVGLSALLVDHILFPLKTRSTLALSYFRYGGVCVVCVWTTVNCAHLTTPRIPSDQALPAVCAVIQSPPEGAPKAAYLGSLRPDLVLWLDDLFLPLLIFEAKATAKSVSRSGGQHYGPSEADL